MSSENPPKFAVKMSSNPCLSCGACCAHFRVSFYWSEAEPSLGGTVPLVLTQPLNHHLRCMQGTDQKNPRCVALQGEIGQVVRCTIYAERPSPCREFAVDWADGELLFTLEDLERCTKARASWGLPPLLDTPGHFADIETPFPPDIPEKRAS